MITNIYFIYYCWDYSSGSVRVLYESLSSKIAKFNAHSKHEKWKIAKISTCLKLVALM